ncbi:MAG TPA: hypothetical protein ENJ07_02485 [Gammaproteobacteria bacterium]|nr:hypothetical protein [Gammaproteobacteria bacterium]
MALDDEVVERGILHHYKDYLFQQQDSKNDTFHRLPITGVEYLEKMIHLPVRLPLPTKHQTTAFLVSRFPELFSVNEREPMKIQSVAKGRQRAQGQSELLDLYSGSGATHTPAWEPIPQHNGSSVCIPTLEHGDEACLT